MVNTINEFQERNKQLLEENENLKKQLADKEQEFKLRILNAVNNVMENERSEIAGTLMTLQQHFWAWGEWVKVQKENGVEKVIFDNEFTIENIVKGFSEWTLATSDSFRFTYDKNKELEEKNAILEKSVAELEITKQELEEALELEEETSDCHLEALEVAKQWRIRQSKEKDDNLEKALKQIELLENVVSWQNYLADKQLQELPTLPRKENKFKLLTNKVKNRVKQAKEITREKFNTYILQKSK
jgi:cell division septum initiation protein DivIVA